MMVSDVVAIPYDIILTAVDVQVQNISVRGSKNRNA